MVSFVKALLQIPGINRLVRNNKDKLAEDYAVDKNMQEAFGLNSLSSSSSSSSTLQKNPTKRKNQNDDEDDDNNDDNENDNDEEKEKNGDDDEVKNPKNRQKTIECLFCEKEFIANITTTTTTTTAAASSEAESKGNNFCSSRCEDDYESTVYANLFIL